MIKVGINGIGRIGKLVFRLIHNCDDMEIVAVNDPMPMLTLVHLLKYDSVHGAFGCQVAGDEDRAFLRINGHEIAKYDRLHPGEIPWNKHDVDVVIESSGMFLTRGALEAHLQPGVKRVILSCPPDEPLDNMVVSGVNEHTLEPGHRIVSNASCTTNCIAPLLKLFDEAWGIDRAFMNTVHPYTNSQNVMDGPHKDLRRARCANENIIPTTTSAIKAVHDIMPSMRDRFDGFASRVPVSCGSFVELNAILIEKASKADVNNLVFEASRNQMRNIIEYCEDPVVSGDIVGNPHSSVFDAPMTRVLGDNFIQVLSWYDNEYAYSSRLTELVRLLA